jgi:uncharacterized MnhB-related membrane protein
MAWLAALCGLLLFPIIIFIAPDVNIRDALVGIAMPYYLFSGAIVGAYIGFSTADDKWKNK